MRRHCFLALIAASLLGGSFTTTASRADDELGDPLADQPQTELVKPDIGEKIYEEGVRWNTVVKQVEIRIPDETPLRQQLAELQRQHASLFSGVELVDLIERTKNDIRVRQAELSERSESFDAKMLAIKQQLEELRRSAAAVGAGDDLETMIQSAGAAADETAIKTGKKPFTPATTPAPTGSAQLPTYKPF